MSETIDNTQTQSNTNLRCLSTWNVWGVPFGSPAIFQRPPKWRAFNDTKLTDFLNSIETIGSQFSFFVFFEFGLLCHANHKCQKKTKVKASNCRKKVTKK